MYDGYYDNEHYTHTMVNTVTNIKALNFCNYFHRVTGLPIETITYITDLDEIFFRDSVREVHSLDKLKDMFDKYNIKYKEYLQNISVDKTALYEFISYLVLAGEWYDEWRNLPR